MTEATKTIIQNIYSRIVPQIPGFSSIAVNDPDTASSIELESADGTFRTLTLWNNPHQTDIIENYRWEFMNCSTGLLVESELDYTATDAEVLSFLEESLKDPNG